jgi:hypothetical protein
MSVRPSPVLAGGFTATMFVLATSVGVAAPNALRVTL